MRNKHKNRILGRTANHRNQLLQSLTSSLLKHGSIITTQAKAKELRLHCEPLITKAKRETTLSVRRQLLKACLHKIDVDRLLSVAEKSKKRPGGYLRLTRLPDKRMDGAVLVRVDIIDVVEA